MSRTVYREMSPGGRVIRNTFVLSDSPANTLPSMDFCTLKNGVSLFCEDGALTISADPKGSVDIANRKEEYISARVTLVPNVPIRIDVFNPRKHKDRQHTVIEATYQKD